MTIPVCPVIESVTFEHYANPLGISVASPRISWTVKSGVSNWYQAEYEIEINKNAKWETFAVHSADSLLVPWPTVPLTSRQKALVRVRARGADLVWTSWGEAEIETALLRKAEWTSSFVTCSSEQSLDGPKRPFRLRQLFTLPATGSIGRARVYITALGVYEAALNGKRLGDDRLAPGWTSYGARLPFQTYDVTDFLHEGENILGAWVGEGWYAGVLGYQGGQRNIFGNRPALLAQLEIDGSPISTEWQWSYGALITSEIYNGEVYDTHLHDDDFGQGEWSAVDTLPTPDITLFSTQSPPVRATQIVKPIQIIRTPSDKIVLDFGQNLAGVVRILNNPPTTKDRSELIFRHAEVLEHGELGTRPLRHARAAERIDLGGRSVKGYTPKFTFHGFRYVEVTGWETISLTDVEAIVLRSSMKRTGEFSCSHSLINRLHENAVWSTMANTIGIPSDCPQRDERLGWTGDVCVFSPTMSYLFDATGFLSEWLQDLAHDQAKLDGVVPIFVPNTGTDVSTPEAIWGDAAVLVPHDVYIASGDSGVLRQQFESVDMWLRKGVQRDSDTRLWDRQNDQLADWLAPRAPPETPNMGPTDNRLVADAWLIHSTRTAAKIASIIGETPKATQYEDEAQRLTDAFYDEYVTATGRLVSETQTALCLLLHFEIYPSRFRRKGRVDYKAIFSERLGELIAKANWLIDTGFAGTPIVLPTLADHGHLSHAYRMLQATQCPSWLSTVLLGATTIWERWDSMLADGTINPGEMTSFNHYALGSVANFMHRYVGGLSPLAPGWKEILVQPRPGGTITSASASHRGPYGKVRIEWEVIQGALRCQVEVPPNCTAHVMLPGKEGSEIVGSGHYDYSVPYVLPPFPPPIYQPHFAPSRPNQWAP